MITFNVRARNGHFYCGHEPGHVSGNCWGDEDKALVLTLNQARRLCRVWPGYLKIEIAVKSIPIADEHFEQELFCASGGEWYLWRHLKRLQRQLSCKHKEVTVVRGKTICSACAGAHHQDRCWYDPVSGTMLDSKLRSTLAQWTLAKKKSEE